MALATSRILFIKRRARARRGDTHSLQMKFEKFIPITKGRVKDETSYSDSHACTYGSLEVQTHLAVHTDIFQSHTIATLTFELLQSCN